MSAIDTLMLRDKNGMVDEGIHSSSYVNHRVTTLLAQYETDRAEALDPQAKVPHPKGSPTFEFLNVFYDDLKEKAQGAEAVLIEALKKNPQSLSRAIGIIEHEHTGGLLVLQRDYKSRKVDFGLRSVMRSLGRSIARRATDYRADRIDAAKLPGAVAGAIKDLVHDVALLAHRPAGDYGAPSQRRNAAG